MPHHLQPVPEDESPRLRPVRDEAEDALADLEDLDFEPLDRPRWWRWVAIAVVAALVVATPLAYGISILLR
jgi:uncharacterized membrane protein YjjP (DUF1212 family)